MRTRKSQQIRRCLTFRLALSSVCEPEFIYSTSPGSRIPSLVGVILQLGSSRAHSRFGSGCRVLVGRSGSRIPVGCESRRPGHRCSVAPRTGNRRLSDSLPLFLHIRLGNETIDGQHESSTAGQTIKQHAVQIERQVKTCQDLSTPRTMTPSPTPPSITMPSNSRRNKRKIK